MGKSSRLSLLGMIRSCGVHRNVFIWALLVWGTDFILDLLIFADRTTGPLVGASFRVTGGFSFSLLLLLITPAIQLSILKKVSVQPHGHPKYWKVLLNQIKFVKTPSLIFIGTFIIILLVAPLSSGAILPLGDRGRETFYLLIAVLLTPVVVLYFFVGCVAASGFQGRESDALRKTGHLVKRDLVLVSILAATQYLGPVCILYLFGTSFPVQAVSGGLSAVVGPFVLVGATAYYFSVQSSSFEAANSTEAST